MVKAGDKMISQHITTLVLTTTAGCIVFAVVITFTLLICIVHKSNHKPSGKRTTVGGELFQHPLFVSQRQNLTVDIEVQSSNETEAALRTNSGVPNGIQNAGKVENDCIKTSDAESGTKNKTSIDNDKKKSVTKSTSLPNAIDRNKKGDAKSAKKSHLHHSVSTSDQPHKHETESKSKQTIDHVNNCGKKTDAVTNTRKVNKEPICLEVIVKRSTACTLDLSKPDNISLMTNSAYGSTSSLRLNSTSPEIHLVEDGNNHISLMTNNAYESSLNLRPNSCYMISDIEKQLPIRNKHGMSFERNPSYLQLPNDLSDMHSEDDDDTYSYVSVHPKTSTWPSVLRDTDLPPIDINGIYVDLDHSFQEEKAPLSNVQFATDESFYY